MFRLVERCNGVFEGTTIKFQTVLSSCLKGVILWFVVIPLKLLWYKQQVENKSVLCHSISCVFQTTLIFYLSFYFSSFHSKIESILQKSDKNLRIAMAVVTYRN